MERYWIVIVILLLVPTIFGNPQARRLFEDLLSGYNKLIRPVGNNSNLLNVKFKLRLSQLLDVHEKNQIMTTNVWLEHEWYDLKLSWKPEDYANVTVLYVPGEMIWLPDIVLYNNADGNYQVTIMTKATVHYTGKVRWDPPAIYKSMCQIDVEWFPFDEQVCHLKFGSWTYDGFQVDLLHKTNDTDIVRYNKSGALGDLLIECVENGIDLSDYYQSTEWDIIAVPGRKKKEIYPCCPTPYIDITYHIHLRRKTLFYTVNLILPCIGISFLTVLVFYLPSDSGEKVTLSISILISLTVFFLLLVEIIPSTSLVVPLIGKYLLFTMVMVTLSICVTVVVINFHFRSPRTHTMSGWLQRWFLVKIPRFLRMSRPKDVDDEAKKKSANHGPIEKGDHNNRLLVKTATGFQLKNLADPRLTWNDLCQRSPDHLTQRKLLLPNNEKILSTPDINSNQNRIIELNNQIRRLKAGKLSEAEVKARMRAERAIDGVQYIAAHLKSQHVDERVMEDWKFVAMVIDRLFLVLFSMACLLGTVTIILQAPTLYDNRKPIDTGDQHVVHRHNNILYCKTDQKTS